MKTYFDVFILAAWWDWFYVGVVFCSVIAIIVSFVYKSIGLHLPCMFVWEQFIFVAADMMAIFVLILVLSIGLKDVGGVDDVYTTTDVEMPVDDSWSDIDNYVSDDKGQVLLTAVRVLELQLKKKITNVQRKSNKILRSVSKLAGVIKEAAVACGVDVGGN